MKLRASTILFLAFFLAFSTARAEEPVCQDKTLGQTALDAFASAAHAVTRKILLSNDLALLEKRLATLEDPACRGRIWPEHKLMSTPLRFYDGQGSVFQFNPETKKLEFLRPATEEDRKVERYNFQNPPEGDGGTILNVAFFRPDRPARPPGEPKPKRPTKPKGALCYEQNLKLIDFMNANTGEHSADQTDDAFSLVVHESFHNVDQTPASPVHQRTSPAKWHPDPEGSRALPGDVSRLQFIRQNAIKYLRDAFAAPSGSAVRRDALAQVKAWMAALDKEFPGASRQLVGVDRAEGTAEFTGMLSNALGKLGCDAAPQTLKAQLLRELDDRMLPVPAPVDSQAYLLGSAAGFLMDDMGERNWKEKVTAGKTPIELLLASEEVKNLPVVPPKADPVLEKSVSITRELHGCMQEETDRAIGKVLAHPQGYVLVQMEKTAFNANGFFSVNTPDGAVDATPQGSSTTGEKLSFLGAPMVLTDGICGGGQNKYVLVPRAAVAADGQIETKPDEVPYYKGSIPPPSSSDQAWNKVPVVCRY